jgi:hypothetical protein
VSGWLRALRTVLALPDCAVAAPGLVPAGAGMPGPPVFGITPSASFLDTAWLDASGADPVEPFPVPSASITAFATTRRAFESVGGFDEGLVDGGGEDLDYCLRLWRTGWRCLAAPQARVRVAFETLPAAPEAVLGNTLRLGLVHLGEQELQEQLRVLAGLEAFPRALAGVTASGAARRRRVVAALSWYDLAGLEQAVGMTVPGRGRLDQLEAE